MFFEIEGRKRLEKQKIFYGFPFRERPERKARVVAHAVRRYGSGRFTTFWGVPERKARALAALQSMMR